jgi:hypothetical protein
MLATKVICPHCSKPLKTSKPLTVGHRVLCSRCGRSFAVRPDVLSGAANGASPSPALVVEQPPRTSPVPRASAAAVEALPAVQPAPAPASVRQAMWIGIVLGGLLLVMGATIGLVVFFATRPAPPDVSAQASTRTPEESGVGTANPPPADAPRLLPPNDDGDPPPPLPDRGRQPEPPLLGDPPSLPTPAPEPERAAWLPPEEQEQVNKAIERGLQWLQKRQTPNGNWGVGAHPVGLAALPALTLLECGVPADDSLVQKAAQYIRKAVPNLTQTYEIALVILFLDRLGDPTDEKLIQTCALRLVAGQSQAGGWTYHCPRLSPGQESDLLLVMQQTRPKGSMDLFVGTDGPAPPGFLTQAPGSLPEKGIQGDSPESKLLPPGSTAPLDKGQTDPETFKKALTRLPPNLRNVPSLQPPEKSHKLPAHDVSDNSNTQFAILGLSAAQRHNLPLERALALIVRRFHKSQVPDGRWNYYYSSPGRVADERPAMTGAGLLGLAVGVGLAADHTRPQAKGGRFEDPAIEKGFQFLARYIGKPLGTKRPRARNSQINLYFLWTVERCGVLFNRREIASKDWYRWGEELLLDHQNADGSWTTGGYFASPQETPITDTCFALLFLKRANLAKDLTKKLEFFMEGKSLQGP